MRIRDGKTRTTAKWIKVVGLCSLLFSRPWRWICYRSSKYWTFVKKRRRYIQKQYSVKLKITFVESDTLISMDLICLIIVNWTNYCLHFFMTRTRTTYSWCMLYHTMSTWTGCLFRQQVLKISSYYHIVTSNNLLILS